MYKAIAQPDTLVALPSGRLAIVVRHLDGNDVEVEYADGSGSLDINAKYLKPDAWGRESAAFLAWRS